MKNETTISELFGEVVHRYTRAEALADGVLIDAGPMAQEAGFQWPVALTTAVWQSCVAWTDDDSLRQVHQDESGRLWDVLFMAAWSARSHADAGATLLYELYCVPRDGISKQPRRTRLKLTVGPGDGGEPVMTILLPIED